MHRKRPGVLQIAQRFKVILCLAAVEVHRHRLLFGIDLLQDSDVAVEDAKAAASVRALPEHVIVVPVLDQAVSHPEDHVPDGTFLFLGRRRVQGRLKELVQGCCAAFAFSCGGKDLNLLRRDPHFLREPRAAQLHHGLGDGTGLQALQPEEVPRVL